VTNDDLLQAFEDAARGKWQDPDSAGYDEDDAKKAAAEVDRLRAEILARMVQP
jgi:hypothetical protein